MDEYAQKHPPLPDQIRDLFPAMTAMEQSGPDRSSTLSAEHHRRAQSAATSCSSRSAKAAWASSSWPSSSSRSAGEVALKVIKPGMDTRQVIARFEAERQALALMDHPNIAKVLDAGDDRRPAARTSSWSWSTASRSPSTATSASLPPRERLELFVPVCQAVQHAHQKGIIHRDLKPSNVLVTLHDGAPVPKVIDFGVAKATGPAADRADAVHAASRRWSARRCT